MLHRAWPLTGRREELDFLVATLTRLDSGGVVLAGTTGVGKSRLAREASDEAEAGGAFTPAISATRATSSIPLAAVAHLIGDGAPHATEAVALFRSVCRTLEEQSAGRRVILSVDDAHLLDDATAALLLHIVTTGAARVIATVRTGEPCPDAVVALWKDEYLTRLELSALSAADAVGMAEGHLGGPLEREARRWITATTGGSPLYVRELVTGALADGTLRAVDGRWQLDGTPRPSQRLIDLVESNLAGLDAEDRHAMELVALAEPLPLDVLDALAGAAAARLERRRLIVVDDESGDRVARVRHPLYAEVMVASLGTAAARQARLALASAFEQTGRRHRGDALRLVTWRLEADVQIDPELLTEAAREANRRFDFALGARLADASIAAGGGLAAALQRAFAASCVGHHADAESVLASWEGRASPAEWQLWGPSYLLERTRTLKWGLGRGAEAGAVLDRAAAWLPVPEWRAVVEGFRVHYLRDEGRYEEVIDAGTALANDPATPEPVRLSAIADVSTAMSVIGRIREAAMLYDGDLPATIEPGFLGSIQGSLTWAWGAARVFAGFEWDRVEAHLEALQSTVRAGSAMWGSVEVLLGRLALLRGQVDLARELLSEAYRKLEDAGDPLMHLPRTVALLSTAESFAGEPALAAASLEQAKVLANERGPRQFEVVDLELADVWLAAVSGELTRAHQLALDYARRDGQSLLGEIRLLYAALTVGSRDAAVCRRLRDQARRTDSVWLHAMADYGDAVLAGDGAALDRVSQAFEVVGALMQAANVAADAAIAHREAGRRASELASRERSQQLLGRCPGARFPAPTGAGASAARLSAREREVAALAARGLSNRAIAERLHLSTRTVESYVYRMCTKLGVSRREDLAALLGEPAGSGC